MFIIQQVWPAVDGLELDQPLVLGLGPWSQQNQRQEV